MKSKIIPFKGKTKKSQNNEDGNIIDSGDFGKLKYKVFSRGVIHITGNNLAFKKNIDSFEQAIDDLDLEGLSEGEEKIINGSGDNDHLVFVKKNGDIEISLKKRQYEVIDKLKNMLSKNRRKGAKNG